MPYVIVIDFNFTEDLTFIAENRNLTMTAAGSPRKKEEKSREDKINEIMADGATAVKMEVDYRSVLVSIDFMIKSLTIVARPATKSCQRRRPSRQRAIWMAPWRF